MIFSFDQMEETVIPHFKGGEQEVAARMYADALNRIMRATLKPGASIGMHTHDAGSEIVYVLQGNATVVEETGETVLSAGMCHYCPKGGSHSIINRSGEDLVLIAVVPNQ